VPCGFDLYYRLGGYVQGWSSRSPSSVRSLKLEFNGTTPAGTVETERHRLRHGRSYLWTWAIRTSDAEGRAFDETWRESYNGSPHSEHGRFDAKQIFAPHMLTVNSLIYRLPTDAPR
jgi:hypothetical protein